MRIYSDFGQITVEWEIDKGITFMAVDDYGDLVIGYSRLGDLSNEEIQERTDELAMELRMQAGSQRYESWMQ